jgi:hypothetical protein
MKQITIQIPDGFVAESIDPSGVIKLKAKPKDVLERILTDLDVLDDNGYTLDSFNQWCEGLAEDERAMRFLKLLNKSLNGDWVPSIDKDEWRYEPRFIGGSSGFRCLVYAHWISGSLVGSRLCFDTEKKAIHAGTKFTKWYKIVITAK